MKCSNKLQKSVLLLAPLGQAGVNVPGYNHYRKLCNLALVFVVTLPNFLFFTGKLLPNPLEQLAWARCSREHFHQLLSKRQGLLGLLIL